ncbi:Hypothetical protein NTJ_03912 [Nesidiocoris tenuis]|uniref:Spaetzle domain-containing protein n=1 Tax=Nesidiocoris tenuis TaxID=355587 RepID=A0ABN7AFT0_9HEMI|nr:Hypothetical protein NTJ_03912 [Nesidiocoris tenuis]
MRVCQLLIIALTTTTTTTSKGGGEAGAPSPAGGPTGNSGKPEDNGYYKFPEARTARPPQVRPPPYHRSPALCEGMQKPFVAGTTHGNLCGDLNGGVIPTNPFHQTFDGDPYPFDLVTKSALKFLSRTLPILQNDETVPKVVNYGNEELKYYLPSHDDSKSSHKRSKRQEQISFESALVALKDFLLESTDLLNITRRARKFCETGNGMVCLLYKAIQGEELGMVAEERKDDGVLIHEGPPTAEGLPPTPCPAKIEYATPVFARNYQGIWRYVVQIPYEGYFTQTVEVTTCIGSRCHYLDGKCMSSPRWVSFLVAEIYYPEGFKETPARTESGTYVFENTTSQNGNDEYKCDGVDANGCYQVRIYYDWFLVPGSCKCWKPDYLHKFNN